MLLPTIRPSDPIWKPPEKEPVLTSSRHVIIRPWRRPLAGL